MPPSARVREPRPGFGPFVRGAPIRFTFDGREIDAFAGESVGAALHASGERVLARSSKYHRPRGLSCMVGKCPSCTCRVDGVPNVRVCTLAARDGMRVETQNAVPGASHDLLALVDRIFPREFAHHTSFTNRALIPFYYPIARRMAGTGTLPEPSSRSRPTIARYAADVVVVGGGVAGLAAAEGALAEGAQVLLVDEADRLGGERIIEERGEAEVRAAQGRLARDLRARVLTRVSAIGLYRPQATTEPHDPSAVAAGRELGTLALALPDRLGECAPRALVVATGAHEIPLLCPGNDLPGVMGARAARILILRYGVRVGERILLVAREKENELVEAMEASGASVVARVDPGDVSALVGRRAVEHAHLRSGERVDIDAVVAVGARTPRVELLQQADAAIDEVDGDMRPRVAADGRTTVPRVFAAGDVALARDARESGRAAGREAAREARDA